MTPSLKASSRLLGTPRGYLRQRGAAAARSRGIRVPPTRAKPSLQWTCTTWSTRLLSSSGRFRSSDRFGDLALVPCPIRLGPSPHDWIVAKAIACPDAAQGLKAIAGAMPSFAPSDIPSRMGSSLPAQESRPPFDGWLLRVSSLSSWTVIGRLTRIGTPLDPWSPPANPRELARASLADVVLLTYNRHGHSSAPVKHMIANYFVRMVAPGGWSVCQPDHSPFCGGAHPPV